MNNLAFAKMAAPKPVTFAGHTCTVSEIPVLRAANDEGKASDRLGGEAVLPVGYQVPCFNTEKDGPSDTPLGHVVTLNAATINAMHSGLCSLTEGELVILGTTDLNMICENGHEDTHLTRVVFVPQDEETAPAAGTAQHAGQPLGFSTTKTFDYSEETGKLYNDLCDQERYDEADEINDAIQDAAADAGIGYNDNGSVAFEVLSNPQEDPLLRAAEGAVRAFGMDPVTEDNIDDWVCLVQVNELDGNKNSVIDWESGALTYAIRKDDLAVGRFDRVGCAFQFG